MLLGPPSTILIIWSLVLCIIEFSRTFAVVLKCGEAMGADIGVESGFAVFPVISA